jgi:hypothetical protein
MNRLDEGLVQRKEGGAKLYIMVFLLLLIAMGLGMGAVLPHYQAKWRLEDRMRAILNGFMQYKSKNPYGDIELAMEEDLRKYTEKQKLGFDPTQSHPQNICKLQAAVRIEGIFECDYTVKVSVLGQYLFDMNMHAEVKVDKLGV